MIHKAFVKVNDKPVARVTFTLPNNLQADTLYLVGDFNEWNGTATPFVRDLEGIWSITVDLRLGRAFQFRYLRNGQEWINDDEADAYVYNPFGTNNFVVVTDPNFKPHDE